MTGLYVLKRSVWVTSLASTDATLGALREDAWRTDIWIGADSWCLRDPARGDKRSILMGGMRVLDRWVSKQAKSKEGRGALTDS